MLMIRFCDLTTLRTTVRRRSKIKALAAALVGCGSLLPLIAQAATIDFNVASGNYDSALDPDAGATPNWIDTTQTNTTIIPVSIPSNAPVGIPGTSDDAFVRNGGTAEISSATTQRSLNVGVNRTLVTDDGITITPNELGG